MRFQFLENGKPVDAQYELTDRIVIVHSRGGRKGADARNSEYGKGLRLLLSRLRKCGVSIQRVTVDSAAVKRLDGSETVILNRSDASKPPEALFTLLSSRMKTVGQQADAKGGNSTKRLRIELGSTPSLESLGARPVNLAHDVLANIHADHLYNAVKRLLDGAAHAFDESDDYDVVVDEKGTRFPPKAVFGLAAAEALGFHVTPYHFKAGLGSPCFKALEDAGYSIVEKAMSNHMVAENLRSIWSEGSERLRSHKAKERAVGLAAAKKASFKRANGVLFCEICGDDFEQYQELGEREAAIEVHHARVTVADMKADHQTQLEDLQCLCANCHRVLHWRIRAEERGMKERG